MNDPLEGLPRHLDPFKLKFFYSSPNNEKGKPPQDPNKFTLCGYRNGNYPRQLFLQLDSLSELSTLCDRPRFSRRSVEGILISQDEEKQTGEGLINPCRAHTESTVNFTLPLLPWNQFYFGKISFLIMLQIAKEQDKETQN